MSLVRMEIRGVGRSGAPRCRTHVGNIFLQGQMALLPPPLLLVSLEPPLLLARQPPLAQYVLADRVEFLRARAA